MLEALLRRPSSTAPGGPARGSDIIVHQRRDGVPQPDARVGAESAPRPSLQDADCDQHVLQLSLRAVDSNAN